MIELELIEGDNKNIIEEQQYYNHIHEYDAKRPRRILFIVIVFCVTCISIVGIVLCVQKLKKQN